MGAQVYPFDRVDVEAKDFFHDVPGTRGTDQQLALYYDETNNFGKLKLLESGLNVSKSDNFVLGGIALKPGQSAGDALDLRRKLRVQASAKEIKFDMVAHGAFDKMLGSTKLSHVLNWLIDHDLGIHYTNLNIISWFTLDIVDSILAEGKFSSYFVMHRELKNELYHIASKNLSGFLSLIYKYNYPNVQRSETANFLKDLYCFLLANWPDIAFPPTNALKEIILRARIVPELCFLEGSESNVLIRGVESFFLYRLCAFKNSSHVFDEEKIVRESIGKYRILNGGREIPYQFVDSKDHFEIQLSDVIVGFLGKYFSYIEKTPANSLIQFKNSFNQVQRNNVTALRKLIERSDSISNVLLHRVTTMDSDSKSDYFVFGTGLSPHLRSTNR
ncbi:DUF3800 domain-containing protein [Pseudomonas sp. NMI4491_12]|uniref:DUF3800 domain-containing protein n=1 Tax=Pseudomonas sp. NMI4491_12 TaxID=2903146 RepID=UPI001E5A5050|nr:DUF3800 domain-containing protein [Pseudomonas sp. NMI4491_12]MCE0968914.1 DUF3800 domain-containing protein [Pseudomonas sp. NMI4491_12]